MSKSYRYGCVQGIVMPIGGLFFACVCVFLFLFVPTLFAGVLLSKGSITLPEEDSSVLLFLWVLSMPSIPHMLAGGNLHPPIDISEKHLTVIFYGLRFDVPWEQIVEMRRMWLPGAPGVLLRVSGGSLPWIYALHGSLNGYWGRYIPIQAGISNYQDLLVEIKRRAPNLKPF